MFHCYTYTSVLRSELEIGNLILILYLICKLHLVHVTKSMTSSALNFCYVYTSEKI